MATTNNAVSKTITIERYDLEEAHEFYKKGHAFYKESLKLEDMSKELFGKHSNLVELNENDLPILAISNNKSHTIGCAYNLMIQSRVNVVEGARHIQAGQKVMIKLGKLTDDYSFLLRDNDPKFQEEYILPGLLEEYYNEHC